MDKLNLGLRWFSHDLANGLSVLRAGVDLDEKEMIEQATAQLIGLLRAVQVSAAEGEGSTDGWQDALLAVGSPRGLDLVFHCERASFKQVQGLTRLFLGLVPRVLSGTLTFTADSTKTSLRASAVLEKVQQGIEESLSRSEPQEAKDIPFYLAKCDGAVKLIVQGEGIELELA